MFRYSYLISRSMSQNATSRTILKRKRERKKENNFRILRIPSEIKIIKKGKNNIALKI